MTAAIPPSKNPLKLIAGCEGRASAAAAAAAEEEEEDEEEEEEEEEEGEEEEEEGRMRRRSCPFYIHFGRWKASYIFALLGLLREAAQIQ
jgi:hypothetical protein